MHELAYTIIRDMIATRKIKPGEYVNERALSTELGIGRTPTHQALEQLTLNRLVQFIPGKGSIVRPIGPRELREITETRSINEELSARLAARNATDSDIEELNGILERAEYWTSQRNIEQLLLLDRSFHACLARMSGNVFIRNLLQQLHERSLGYWFNVLDAPGQIDDIAAEHAAIIDAVKRRDEDAAGLAMARHIKSVDQAIAEAYSGGTSAVPPRDNIDAPRNQA